MSEDWDFYMCEIEDHVASIFLNLSLIYDAPFEAQTQLLSLNTTMQHPREDGLSSKQEADSLYELEDQLVEIIEQHQGQYVGRLTYQGHRVFYAYLPTDTTEECLQQLQTAKAPIDILQEEDTNWAYYKEWLYPAPLEMHDIQNRRVVMKLSEYGDQLDTARPVDHTAIFASQEDALAFKANVEADGFIVDIQEDDSSQHVVEFQREDHVDIDNINALVRQLVERVQSYNGTYDGWGCPIVA